MGRQDVKIVDMNGLLINMLAKKVKTITDITGLRKRKVMPKAKTTINEDVFLNKKRVKK